MSEKKTGKVTNIEEKRRKNKRKARLKYLYDKKMLTIVLPTHLDDRLQRYKQDNDQTYIQIFDDFLIQHGY